jgi:predicted GTPase
VVLVVEGGQTRFSKVDLQIAHRCAREGRSLVIAANKADLVEQGGLGLPEYEEVSVRFV